MKIFLTGFMGSGKSHWGRVWAGRNQLHFYDLDKVIEASFRMSITQIFETEGEEKFRELERLHLRKFAVKKNFILACGGGTPCFFDNMHWMKEQGTVIYIKADAELILQQVINETAQRPVIKNVNPSELLFFIQKKLEERMPYYLQANIIANVEELTEDSLSNLIDK